jgi:hypothetical protein
MRKIFFISLLIFSCAWTFAQSDSIMYKYCDVVWAKKVAGSKYCIAVDSGQVESGGLLPNQYKDKDGEAYAFNSPVDGINFVALKKWELCLVYYDGSFEHYIMKKRIK